MGSFLDVTAPPLMLLAFLAFLSYLGVRLGLSRARLWDARRHRIEGVRTVLGRARDGLACAVSDPGAGDSTRSQALAAYEAVCEAISKESK